MSARSPIRRATPVYVRLPVEKWITGTDSPLRDPAGEQTLREAVLEREPVLAQATAIKLDE